MQKIYMKLKRLGVLTLALVLSFGYFFSGKPVSATPSSIERISVDSSGGNADENSPANWGISDDGRYVLFVSSATDLVAGDTNAKEDIFVRDTVNDTTERISVDSSEAQANGDSDRGAISADGRYVVFRSAATNLVAGDTNGKTDIFIRDRTLGTTTLASVDSSGGPVNDHIDEPQISSDGRFVAFSSFASDLVSGDTNAQMDIFVRDLLKNQTTRISVSEGGVQGNGQSLKPMLSCDGRYVAFTSLATNLVAGDTNGYRDVFLYDSIGGVLRNITISGNDISSTADITCSGEEIVVVTQASNLITGDTNGKYDVMKYTTSSDVFERASLADDESEPNDDVTGGMVSGDGRYVAFESVSTNLIANDTNAKRDIFLRDMLSGTTIRISEKADGTQANDSSFFTSFSKNGKYIAFTSPATNLVTGDTNAKYDVFLADTGNSSNTCY